LGWKLSQQTPKLSQQTFKLSQQTFELSQQTPAWSQETLKWAIFEAKKDGLTRVKPSNYYFPFSGQDERV
jgi:hypothetical protein